MSYSIWKKKGKNGEILSLANSCIDCLHACIDYMVCKFEGF